MEPFPITTELFPIEDVSVPIVTPFCPSVFALYPTVTDWDAFAVASASWPTTMDSLERALLSLPTDMALFPFALLCAPKAVAPSFASALLPIATESFSATVLSPYAVPFSPFASACQPTATPVLASVLLFPPMAIEPAPLAMAFPALLSWSFPPMAIVWLFPKAFAKLIANPSSIVLPVLLYFISAFPATVAYPTLETKQKNPPTNR